MSARELTESAFWLETNDAPLLHHDLTLADLAHIIHLIEEQLIPLNAGCTLLQLLLDLDADAQFTYDPQNGDAFSNRLKWLSERAPDAAGYLSTGRARREATTVAFHLRVRRDLLRLARGVCQLQDALLELAAKHVETVMPDYTYLQPAQPTSLAHYLLSFVYPLRRDAVRVRDAFEETDQSPAGIGSINGSRLNLRRERLAELLGFGGLVTHTRDAMWQVEVPVAATSAAATCLLHADRLAEDLEIFASNEFGMVTLADDFTRPSVIMPQKKNPYSLAFVRGAAGTLISRVTEAHVVARTPTAQADNRLFSHGEVPRALDLSTRAFQLMAGVVNNLQICQDQMARAVEGGFLQATDLAEEFARVHGLDYQSAYRVVAYMVGRLQAVGLAARDITPELLETSAKEVLGHPLTLTEEQLKPLLDPRAIVRSRTGTGGAAPERVREMIDECRTDLGRQIGWVDQASARIERAEKAIAERASEIVRRGRAG